MPRLFKRRTPDEYPEGSCTRFVYDTVPWVPLGWGDAHQWAESARHAGLTVDDNPRPGCVAAWDKQTAYQLWGHVAVVENVPDKYTVHVRQLADVPRGGWPVTTVSRGSILAYIHPPTDTSQRLPRGALHNGRGDSVDPVVSVVQAYETMRAYYNLGAAVQLLGLAAVGVEYNTLL